MEQYINHNGILTPSSLPVIGLGNRSFRYGDGLFETIRISNHKPQFIPEHVERLRKGAQVMKMKLPEKFNEAFLEGSIGELAEKNGVAADGRVRLSVYRNDGGFYAPEVNDVSYALEVDHLDEQGYILNPRGFTVDLFMDFKKQQNSLASVKSANSSIYVLAGIHKRENQLDECLLLNDKHNIVEAISSNVFAVKNGVLYTPPVEDGCVEGVMRRKIIEIAKENRIAVYEISVMQNVLLGADELFLTNTINGIRWIVAYKQKRYFNNTSKKLIEKLNASLI